MPSLDQHLEATRDDLLRQIQIPELAAVKARAASIRRRRRGLAAGGAALACLVVLGTGTVLLGDAVRGPDRGQPVASDSGPAGLYWRGGGLTMLGLNGTVLDQPGDLRDIQFADSRHGYALSAQCDRDATRPCALAVASTTDGGRTWIDLPLPVAQAPADRLPSIVAVGADGLVLVGDTVWFGHRGGGWQQRTVDTRATVAAMPNGGRLELVSNDVGYAAPTVAVWSADGSLARLSVQPGMAVHWVASAPAADGAWWVGGTLGGAPAVGVTRDAGRTWKVTPLAGATSDAWAQVSTLGSDAYATVVSPRGGDPGVLTIHAVYRSPAGGPFTPYASMIGTLVGDIVPLLDGRLVAAGPNWYVNAGRDSALKPAGGSMPWVGRVERTAGGWIAYDLFQAGWAAISRDGETWQKINVH